MCDVWHAVVIITRLVVLGCRDEPNAPLSKGFRRSHAFRWPEPVKDHTTRVFLDIGA